MYFPEKGIYLATPTAECIPSPDSSWGDSPSRATIPSLPRSTRNTTIMTPPTHCPLKLTTVPASLCIVSLLTSPAAALSQDRYDLASLILESYAVILAERGPQRPLKNWAAATPYTVRKVYRGGMIPGQKIEVFEHTREDPAKGLRLYYDGAKTMAVDREAILVVGGSGGDPRCR